MFGDRIKILRKQKSITQMELADKLHVAYGTVAMWETNKRQPDFDMTKSIADFFGVSVDYLLDRENVVKLTKSGTDIPILGSVPAGTPIEAIEDVLGYVAIPEQMAQTGTYFALQVVGDSMIPTIKENDIVIIRQQDDAESGSICIVMIDGSEATLKEIKKEAQGIWVLPHNPYSNFKPTFFSNQEVINIPVRILGKVVEIRRSL